MSRHQAGWLEYTCLAGLASVNRFKHIPGKDNPADGYYLLCGTCGPGPGCYMAAAVLRTDSEPHRSEGGGGSHSVSLLHADQQEASMLKCTFHPEHGLFVHAGSVRA